MPPRVERLSENTLRRAVAQTRLPLQKLAFLERVEVFSLWKPKSAKEETISAMGNDSYFRWQERKHAIQQLVHVVG